jgi:hypothetical protein
MGVDAASGISTHHLQIFSHVHKCFNQLPLIVRDVLKSSMPEQPDEALIVQRYFVQQEVRYFIENS